MTALGRNRPAVDSAGATVLGHPGRVSAWQGYNYPRWHGFWEILIFHLPIEPTPRIPVNEILALRLKLIDEEFAELKDTFTERNIVHIAKDLADLFYVVHGVGISCGLDIDPIFEAVHRSNLTKIGGSLRQDGKILKPEHYQPPQLESLLDTQTQFPS